MKACIVVEDETNVDTFNNFLISLKNLNYEVSIGKSIINDKFKGSNTNDLTNIEEKNFDDKKKLTVYSDIYIFTSYSWSMTKALTRILRSIEYKLLDVKYIYLYNSKNWKDFLSMLNKFNNTDILEKIKLIDVEEIVIKK